MSLLPLFSLPNSHQHCPVATTTQCCVPYCAGGEEGEGIAGIPAVLIMRTNNDDAEREREKGGELLPKVFFRHCGKKKGKKGMTGPPARSVRQCYFCPERMDGRTSFFGPLSFFSDTLAVATTKSFWFVGEEVGGVFWYCTRWGGVRTDGCAAARRPPREGRTDGGGGGTCCVCTGPWIWWAMLMIVGRRRVNEEVGREGGREGGRKPSR